MKKLLATVALTLCTAFGSGAAFAQEPKWTEVKLVTEGGFVPWNYTKPDGSLAGFEIDLAKDLCAKMQVKCTMSAQSFDSMIPALNAGKYDAIIDNMGITPKREEVVAFTVPYASICYTFGALKNSDFAKAHQPNDLLVSLNDPNESTKAIDVAKRALKGRNVGTLASGTSVEFVKAFFSDTVTMRQYKTIEARDLDLMAGRIDAIVGSKDSLQAATKKPGNENLVLAGSCYQGGVLGKGAGIGLRKSDAALKAMFDKAIRAAQVDGTIKRLSEAAFGIDVTPR